jgi:hypothetical protein
MHGAQDVFVYLTSDRATGRARVASPLHVSGPHVGRHLVEFAGGGVAHVRKSKLCTVYPRRPARVIICAHTVEYRYSYHISIVLALVY